MLQVDSEQIWVQSGAKLLSKQALRDRGWQVRKDREGREKQMVLLSLAYAEIIGQCKYQLFSYEDFKSYSTKNYSTAILPLSLTQEEQLSVTVH